MIKLLMVISLLSSCQGKNLKEQPEPVAEYRTSEKVESVKNDSVLFATNLLNVEVGEFFLPKSIRKLEYDETTIKYLAPIALFVDSTGMVFIHDVSRSRITGLRKNGEQERHFDLGIKDLFLTKLFFTKNGYLYAIDEKRGLLVYDENMKLVRVEENTVDFYFDEKSNNLYLQKNLNNERFIFDIKETMEMPLSITYNSVFINNDNLFGIEYFQNSFSFDIDKVFLPDLETLESSEYQGECPSCFILPKFIDENKILTSREVPFLDQLSIIENKEIETLYLKYPNKIDALISFESAGYAYTGYVYYYDKKMNALYSLATDNEMIHIYKFDLNKI